MVKKHGSCLVLALLALGMMLTGPGPAAADSDPEISDAARALTARNAQAALMAVWRLGVSAAEIEEDLLGDVWPALAGALDDPDWRVRWLAAETQARLYELHSALEQDYVLRHGSVYASAYPDLLRLLATDPEPAVREAAARAVLVRASTGGYSVPGEVIEALNDDSVLVRELATEFIVRSITAGPYTIEDLLWTYHGADELEFYEAERFLERQARQGHADAAGGEVRLEEHISELRGIRSGIKDAISRAGRLVVPALIEMYEKQPALRTDIIRLWSAMGTEAVDAAAVLAGEIADTASAQHRAAVYAIAEVRPRGDLDVADALLPFVIGDKTEDAAFRALKALGPLPEQYVDLLIEQIQARTVEGYCPLIRVLEATGADSTTAVDFLAALLHDDRYENGQLLAALATMGRLGNVAAAKIALKESSSRDQLREIILRYFWFEEDLFDHPQLIGVIADQYGAADLALLKPELLDQPEFSERARAEIVAEISDSHTSGGRIIALTPLLTHFEQIPPEVSEVIADQFPYATQSDTEYAHALAVLNPARAREIYLELQGSEDYRDSVLSGALLAGLGAEAVPLLEAAVSQLIGEEPSEELQRWFDGQPEAGGIRIFSHRRAEATEVYQRRRLALAIGACGPQAAPYARHLLWALKRAHYDRSLATIPVSALSRSPESLERVIDHSHWPQDALIEALSEALIAMGPATLDDVVAVAAGSLNDSPVRSGSSAEYRNPEYDQRLRIAAYRIIGSIGLDNGDVTPLLMHTLISRDVPGWPVTGEVELESESRAAIVEALGKIGGASEYQVRVLLDVALDEDPELRAAAVNALRMLAGWEYSLVEE